MGDREDAYRQLFKRHTEKIPEHDLQTGELNPYYEELTGEKNPMGEYNKVGILKEKKSGFNRFNNPRTKNIKSMPDQYWHRIISFVKSAVRLIGYAFIPFDLLVATLILIISEIIGIVEELV